MFQDIPPFYEMRNPFLVLRLALFGILVYVNVLTIGFAAWNLTVLKDLEVSVLGSPTFVVFNSCLLITLLALSLASTRFSIKYIDQVRSECAWTGVLSALQLASSFAITANGPPVLCQGISILACASSSIVVALSWISCMILVLYSFSLFTTAITHMSVVEDIWSSSVCSIPWFVGPSTSLPYTPRPAKMMPDPEVVDIKRMSSHYPTPIFEQHAKALPPSPKSELPRYSGAPPSSMRPYPKSNRSSIPPPSASDRRTTWTSLLFANSRPPSLAHKQSRESVRPNWAKRSSPRRGVDSPFAAPRFSISNLNLPPVRPLRPLKLKSVWSQTTVSSPPPVPALPQRAHVVGASAPSHSPTGTFYIDLERDAVVPVGDASRPVSYGMFPEDVMDPDLPVAKTRRSQWVRAGSETSSA